MAGSSAAKQPDPLAFVDVTIDEERAKQPADRYSMPEIVHGTIRRILPKILRNLGLVKFIVRAWIETRVHARCRPGRGDPALVQQISLPLGFSPQQTQLFTDLIDRLGENKGFYCPYLKQEYDVRGLPLVRKAERQKISASIRADRRRQRVDFDRVSTALDELFDFTDALP